MSLMSDCNLLTCIFINIKFDWHELHVPNIVSVNQKLSYMYDYHIMMWYCLRSILPDLILHKFDLRLIFYIYLALLKDTLSRGCCMIFQYKCSHQPITLLFIRKIELLHCSLDLDYTGSCNKQYIVRFFFAMIYIQYFISQKNILKLCQPHMYYVL